MASNETLNNICSSENRSDEIIQIPVEIVSEEEMAFIEAALASTCSAFFSSSLPSLSSSSSSSRSLLVSSLPSLFTPLRKHSGSLRAAADQSRELAADIEDLKAPPPAAQQRIPFLQRFRSKRGLTVTDITATEWCEKQMEYALLRGKPKRNKAMKAGSARHTELEEEVVIKVKIKTKSIEEYWAVRLLNFITGATQLLFEGLTRELPVLGVVNGVWMIGVIDELRLPRDDATISPFLVDTKTRCRATAPSEAQKRNARLQLMCYKYLWDDLVRMDFPTDFFFNHFHLNPQYTLSEEVKHHLRQLGSDAKTFKDVVAYFEDTCCLLSPSQEQLILRYELQSDKSLLEEYQFTYEADWFSNQLQECINFWIGDREAKYVSEDEKWKCQFCSFTEMCPVADNKKMSE